jgi:O-acetyl-ADP-ribose deacetylase (regulator of RNase III)
MINYKTGNILGDKSEALVNTVNTVGVMGKGIALAFKNSFPQNFKAYSKAVEEGTFKIGTVQVVPSEQILPKYIINFPTKIHWRQPSKLSYIEEGLKALIDAIEKYQIKSIAIPPVGCGNGNLNWKDVKPLIEKYLSEISKKISVTVFEPGYNDQIVLQKKDIKLTPARAMLLHLLNQYQVLGYSINLLVAQKISYFLQKAGEPLNLQFEKGPYGPYAHRLQHLLNHLNGTYIHFKPQDTKPGTTIKFIKEKLDSIEQYVSSSLHEQQKKRIERVIGLIEGFETPFGMELLATVDFVKSKNPTHTLSDIQTEIHNWTNRKRDLMKPHHITVAYNRLQTFFEIN